MSGKTAVIPMATEKSPKGRKQATSTSPGRMPNMSLMAALASEHAVRVDDAFGAPVLPEV